MKRPSPPFALFHSCRFPRRKSISAVIAFVALALPISAMAQGPSGFKAPVAVMTMAKQPLQYTQTAPGRVKAHKIAEVRPQVTGIVLKRFFEEGSMVKKGQPLYQIDPATYQAVYDSAMADLLKAKAQYESTQAKDKRYSRLVKDRAVSRQDYDDAHAAFLQANASVAVAEAAVARAKINLDYTRVYAPITGRIGKSSVTEGALVTANQATMMAEITQLNPIYVDMQQARRKLFELKALSKNTDKIMVKLDYGENEGQYAHMGELQFSEVTVDPSTSSVVLRALFPNPEEELYPGYFVRATLFLDKTNVLLVPQKAAIMQPGGKMMVWVMDKNSTVRPQPIEVDGTYKNQWIVTSGLKEGETIITEGYQRLRPGAEVDASPKAQALAKALNG